MVLHGAKMTPEEALNLILEAFRMLSMTQAGYEARDFAVFCSERDISNVLELGTCAGGMMYVMDRACKPGLRISMDMPWKERDPSLPDYWERRFRDQLPHVVEILGQIHDWEQHKRLADFLAGRNLDLIFADADHSYVGSKQHFEMYTPFLRPGGFFAIHDVANHHPCQDWWEREVMPKYENWRWAEPVNTYGIGCCRVP